MKEILVHVDHADGVGTRVETAAELAAAHGARLSGLYVRPTIEIPILAQSFGGHSLDEAIAQAADEAAGRAKALFERQAQAAGGAVAPRWLEATGDAAEMVTTHARYVDLVVIGPSDADKPGARRTSGQIILESAAPVLVVPTRPSVTTLGQRVLIAWNGSREAVHAVRGALPILRRASAVEILIVTAAPPDPAVEPAPGRELADFLATHGVRASVKLLGLEDAYGVSGSMLARAKAVDADLIVMGGFGRSRLREAAVGSTTGTLLGRSGVPLLIAH